MALDRGWYSDATRTKKVQHRTAVPVAQDNANGYLHKWWVQVLWDICYLVQMMNEKRGMLPSSECETEDTEAEKDDRNSKHNKDGENE